MSDGPKILEFPPSSTWREVLMLLGVAVALAAIAWFVHPQGLPLVADAETYDLDLPVPLIEADAALAAYGHDDSFLVFVDTRPYAMELEYIPTAVILRPDSFEVDVRVLIEDFEREDALILYADDDLIIPSAIASRLIEREFLNARIMRGGFPAWVAAGGPSEMPYVEATP